MGMVFIIFPGVPVGRNDDITTHGGGFHGGESAGLKPAGQYMHFCTLIIRSQCSLVKESQKPDIRGCDPAAGPVISVLVWRSRANNKQTVFCVVERPDQVDLVFDAFDPGNTQYQQTIFTSCPVKGK